MQVRHFRPVVIWLTLLATIAFNAAAQLLPLNGVTTGEVSDGYQVFVTPAGYAFSIWSLIYAGLMAFAVRRSMRSATGRGRLEAIDLPLILSCAANVAWLWLWHHGFIAASLAAMLGLLFSLSAIYRHLGREPPGGTAEFWTVDATFGLYTGWVTVATLVNLSVVLEQHSMRPFGLDRATWALVMVVAATVIAIAIAMQRRDPTYLAAVLWAVIGIAFAPGQQETVAMTAWTSASVLAVLVFWTAADRVRSRTAA